MKMRHSDLLSRTFLLPWRLRSLWILGFAMALLTAGSSLGNLLSLPERLSAFSLEVPPPQDVRLDNLSTLLLILGCLYPLFEVPLAVLYYVARAGLIRAAVAADAGEAVSWRQGLAWGWSRWAWRHFLQDLTLWAFVYLPLGVLFLVVVFALAWTTFEGSGSEAVVVGLLCLFGPLFLLLLLLRPLLSPWLHLAQSAVVLEDLGPWEGFGRGWRLLKGNLKEVVLLFLFSAGVILGWKMAVAPVDLLLFVLLLGPAAVLYLATARLIPALVVGGLGFLLFLLADAVLEGYLNAFVAAYWTLGYRELAADGAPAPSPSV